MGEFPERLARLGCAKLLLAICRITYGFMSFGSVLYIFFAMTSSRWSIKTREMDKKCSLAVIGKVSALTSRL